jgi:hypothetical protein
MPSQVVLEIDIDCAEAARAGEQVATTIAKDGKLFTGKVAIQAGETAMDALKATGLVVTTKDYGAGRYVDSIGGLVTGATGPSSGWIYSLNDEQAMVSLDTIVPQDGDSLTFKYQNSFE